LAALDLNRIKFKLCIDIGSYLTTFIHIEATTATKKRLKIIIMKDEITTPKHNLLVTVEITGDFNLVECEATQRHANGDTDTYWTSESFETGADPEWNDVYDMQTALDAIDARIDRQCEEFGSSIYQL